MRLSKGTGHCYETSLPAGRYWVGDPALMFQSNKDKKKWDKIIKDTNFFLQSHYQDPALEIWASDTVYGEGFYYSNDDRYVIVESGLIGIIPFSQVVKRLFVDSNLHTRGIVISQKERFPVIFYNGLFKFGDLEFDTSVCPDISEEE